MSDLTRFNHSQSQWRLQPHMKEPGCREWNLYKSIVAHFLPPSLLYRPLNPWQSSHRPCAESMSGLGCNRGEEGKERQGWRRRKEAVNTHKKRLELELEEGMAWGGDLWRTFITTQHCPREVREEGWGGRGKTFPFPFLFFPYTGATQGVESFVSLLAAVEEAGEVVFALKCWI